MTVKRRPKNGFKEMRKQERRRCLPVLTGPAGHGVADKLYLISALIRFAKEDFLSMALIKKNRFTHTRMHQVPGNPFMPLNLFFKRNGVHFKRLKGDGWFCVNNKFFSPEYSLCKS